ncbi:hypothetical protein JCM19241_804 [Vibrio ishigakensis]|uniref:Uncharacterized protein n=1 Tax=Vibrio ishigakensis TaxID=1481914 RepID=A0A0B8QHP6_9VIBR|nr:hypothetical protein JCM19241_804 [Vibrio ishigakensis]
MKRENALFIQISYWELAFAFDWIKQVVAEHSDSVEHIFINSHDGLVGAKYGQTRELIVEGNKSDVRGEMLEEHWDEIRDFFYEHDIIWNQGHEHLYQRSVIKAPEYQVEPSGSTPTGGNYRLPVYTQVISGNASYKGYDFRYGERDYVQDIIQMKMSTLNNESSFNLDVNAAQFSIEGNRIRYQAFVAPHTILDNAEGPKELANPDWVLMDQFDRTTNRCEKVVDAITIKAMMETGDARPDGHDYTFRTIPCMDSNELYARILGGENTLFNRIQNVERVIGWDEQSRAEDPSALWARMHNYLYQDHEAWSPNFNAKERAINGDTDEEFKVPATSMDMKKLITLSWQAPTQSNMVSDILIVSGMTTHTGTYQDANGGELDIEIARGVRTTFDDWQKPSEEMPDNAIKNWDLSKQTSVPYAIEFDLPESETPETVSLAAKQEGAWAMLSSAECIVNVPYDDSYLETPPTPNEGCDDAALIVGYDRDQHAFWTIAHSDIELAIIK